MLIDIVTVFPEMVSGALSHSIIKRAVERGLVTIRVVNLRDFTRDRHKTTDDIPYGGGGGMVMKVEPIALALASLKDGTRAETEPVPEAYSVLDEGDSVPETPDRLQSPVAGRGPRIVLTDPRGMRFDQAIAQRWAQEEHLILLCGHYEGVDDRVRQNLVTDEVSIGDYILTGGELPALVIVDAITRLQTGALGDIDAPNKDTFAGGLLEYPHYTRPRDYAGWTVPDVLLSGHHAEIERWRRWHQLHETRTRRPDLFDKLPLSRQDIALLSGPEPTVPSDQKLRKSNDNDNENHEETYGTGI
jgi:tRNA (guanine37-N1)-methyltransferase